MRNEVGLALFLSSHLREASLTQGTIWAMSTSIAFTLLCPIQCLRSSGTSSGVRESPFPFVYHWHKFRERLLGRGYVEENRLQNSIP